MESRLFLETDFSYGKTNIKDIYFTSPYKIMSPFTDGSHMEVMLMSSSAGLLGGDSFMQELVFGENSDVTFTSQSYEKVFHTKALQAVKRTSIKAGASSRVKYMPYPVIPFSNSNFYSETNIQLDKTSNFLYCDIFTCGRTGMGEFFEMQRYQSKTKIYVDGKLAFADHTLIDPKQFDYRTMGMWGSFTHNGLLYLYTADQNRETELVEHIRAEAAKEEFPSGVTRCRKGIVVRTLAMSGEKIYKLFQRAAELV